MDEIILFNCPISNFLFVVCWNLWPSSQFSIYSQKIALAATAAPPSGENKIIWYTPTSHLWFIDTFRLSLFWVNNEKSMLSLQRRTYVRNFLIKSPTATYSLWSVDTTLILNILNHFRINRDFWPTIYTWHAISGVELRHRQDMTPLNFPATVPSYYGSKHVSCLPHTVHKLPAFSK